METRTTAHSSSVMDAFLKLSLEEQRLALVQLQRVAEGDEQQPPSDLVCCITFELFRDPVVNCVGRTYERAALEKAYERRPYEERDPFTNLPLNGKLALFDNLHARGRVLAWLEAHPSALPWDGGTSREVIRAAVTPEEAANSARIAEEAAAAAAEEDESLMAAAAARWAPEAVAALAAAAVAAANEAMWGPDDDEMEEVGEWRNSVDGMRVLLRLAENDETLPELSLSRLDLAAVSALCSALAGNHSLGRLELSGCDVGDAGAAALGHMLAHNSVLMHLDLSSNDIGAAGAFKLARALAVRNFSLTRLNLRGNRICDQGAAVLGHMLGQNTCLEELDLAGNDIGSVGAVRLAGGLAANTKLTELDLSLNNIGHMGAAALSHAMGRSARVNDLVWSRPAQ